MIGTTHRATALAVVIVFAALVAAPAAGEEMTRAEKIRALLYGLKRPAAPPAVTTDRPAPAPIPAPAARPEAGTPAPLEIPTLTGAAGPANDSGQVEIDAGRLRDDICKGGQPYRLGPGDVIELSVYDNQEFSKPFTVSPDGSIMIPMFGRVNVAGLTPDEAAGEIRRRLSTILTDPQVVVMVREFNNNYVLLLGRVGQPGRYDFKGMPTLLELFSMAKGVTPLDSGTAGAGSSALSRNRFGRATIFRGADQIIEIDLDKLLIDGMVDLNLPLRCGDIVNVPFLSDQNRFYVLGQVGQPGMFGFQQGLTVMQALSMAQNSREKADLKRVRIIRTDGERRKVMFVDVAAILRGKHVVDEPLKRDDIIYVPMKGSEKFIYSINWINTALSTVMIGDSVARVMEGRR